MNLVRLGFVMKESLIWEWSLSTRMITLLSTKCGVYGYYHWWRRLLWNILDLMFARFGRKW